MLHPGAVRCLYKLRVLEMGVISGHSSPESQPAVFVDQGVTSLIHHNILHSIFSFCSVSMAPMPYIHFVKTSPVCQHPSLALCSLSSPCIRRQPKTGQDLLTSKYNFQQKLKLKFLIQATLFLGMFWVMFY